jgi:hypothetical protein
MTERIDQRGRGSESVFESVTEDERQGAKILAMVDSYVELLNVISQKVKDERTAVAIMQEIGKDRRRGEILRVPNWGAYALATEGQMEMLRDLAIAVPADITREKASELIDEEVAKREANLRCWRRL